MKLNELGVILGQQLVVQACSGKEVSVWFPSVELSEYPFLRSCSGNDITEKGARREYAKQLAGKEIRCEIQGQVVYMTLPETLVG